MSGKLGTIEGLYEDLQKISSDRREEEAEWFLNNKPVKEFVLEQDGGPVHYAVWDFSQNEDFLVMFKSENEHYHFRHRLTLQKQLVKELASLL